MKAGLAADVHGDMTGVRNLGRQINPKDVDFIFLLGDYSRFGSNEQRNKSDVTAVLDTLEGFNVKAIPGNSDHPGIIDVLEGRDANLHFKVLKLPGLNVIGFGGSNPTPYESQLTYSEEEIRRNLEDLYAGVDEGVKVVLLTHVPPKDTKCDETSSGRHIGSEALRKFIEEKQPDLVLCSHNHDAVGVEDRIGKTRVMVLGMLSEHGAYTLEVSDKIEVKPLSPTGKAERLPIEAIEKTLPKPRAEQPKDTGKSTHPQ
jgi:Icc-related predicted phosphoesterase